MIKKLFESLKAKASFPWSALADERVARAMLMWLNAIGGM